MLPRRMFSRSKPKWNSATLVGHGGRGATLLLRKQLCMTFSQSPIVSGIARVYWEARALRSSPAACVASRSAAGSHSCLR